jgi:hypothetical protein
MKHQSFKPAAGAQITFFHTLWLSLVVATAFTAWEIARHLSFVWRLLITAAAAVLAVPLCSALVMLLVTSVVMPRLRGEGWKREVNGYMLSMLGQEWEDAGKPAKEHTDESS